MAKSEIILKHNKNKSVDSIFAYRRSINPLTAIPVKNKTVQDK